MLRRSVKTGILISDDPKEVNPVCLVLKELNTLRSCPEWGRCNCAVCEAERREVLEADMALSTKSNHWT